MLRFRTPIKTYSSPALLLDDDGHVFLIDEEGDFAPSTMRLDDYTPNALKEMTISSDQLLAVRAIVDGELGHDLQSDEGSLLHFDVHGRELRLTDGMFVAATLPHERDGWRTPDGVNVGALMIGPVHLLDRLRGATLTPAAPLGRRSRLSPLAERHSFA